MNRNTGMHAGQVIGWMNGLQVVGMDIAKSVFQLYTADMKTGELRDKRLKRDKVLEYFRLMAPAVVVKPVPAGATAVGNPARIIQADADVRREQAASQMGFSAYGVTQSDDPLSQAMRGLIDNASSQEHQIALLWQAIEKLSQQQRDCVPVDAARQENFQADKLSQMVGK